MKRTTPAKPHPGNAFAVLMGGSSKKKKLARDYSSRFVLCPAGCGKHLPMNRDINAHLDVCMGNTSVQTQQNNTPEKDHPSARDPVCISQSETEENASPPLPSQKSANPSSGKASTPASNIFSHMMKHSAKVFSTKEPPKLQQSFHLHADGSISLTCYNRNKVSQPTENKGKDSSLEPEGEGIRWSTTVHFRAPKVSPKTTTTRFTARISGDDDVPDDSVVESSPEPSAVDLLVSSDLQSLPPNSRPRLVQKHSRLSISVLKSILQKSIRRRRPLPAVRVAMELADKSLGDLLRRLPIIVLEDSFLHPSFAFLTWLMVAHSKNFEPSLFLLRKVLCVVYEIASCPWQDHLLPEERTTDAEPSSDLSFDIFHKHGVDNILDDNDTTIWSMLVRKRYGGMGGDIRMLELYANAWKERFEKTSEVPHIAKERLKAFVSDNQTLTWSMLPARLHQTSMRQSLSRVAQITNQSLRSLTLVDITTEGVDFHCSDIIENILSDPETVSQFQSRLATLVADEHLDPPPQSNIKSRSWLERILKQCMWNYSAGVNRRLSVTDPGPSVKKGGKELEDIWRILIQPKARLFAQRYVQDRLAVPSLP